MSILRTRVLLGAALAALFAVLSLASPPAAQADRCQPEELVGQPPLTAESDNPVCVVMLDMVYPGLACDSTTMRRCVETLSVEGTLLRAPETALATPGRSLGAAGKIAAIAKRRAVGDGWNCDIGIFRPQYVLQYYYWCELNDPLGAINLG